jgi:hypothetical protein
VTPDDIKQLRKELGCTARDLATTLGTNEAVLFYDAPRSLGFNASFTF